MARVLTGPRLAAAVVAAALAVTFAPATGAQTSTSSTTTPGGLQSDTTTTTVPTTVTPTTTPTSETTTPPVTDPGTVPPQTIVTIPPTDIPTIDPSVPLPTDGAGVAHDDEPEEQVQGGPTPKGPWDGVGITNPRLAGLVAQVDASQNRLLATRRAVTDAEAALGTATATRVAAEGVEAEAASRYAATRERFSRRVAASYVAGGNPNLRLQPERDLAGEADRVVLPGAVTASDRRLAEDYRQERDALSDKLRGAVEAETAATLTLEAARAALVEATAAATEAEKALASTPENLAGFVFPVAGPTSFISSFGFCRDGCRRSHQGNDLFARAGTPVVAAEDGWVERVGTNSLGGLIVWTRGRSGYRYYYAHLRDWAPLVEGAPIAAGTVVGTVGNTGNAATTPSHLHFEIHPGNAAAIDPYPILVKAPRVQLPPEAVALASGISPEQAALSQAAAPPPGG